MYDTNISITKVTDTLGYRHDQVIYMIKPGTLELWVGLTSFLLIIYKIFLNGLHFLKLKQLE